ncbi:hypothetical protein EI94DRAFT_747908 [Lactarius quietus]|nr:hypothetical protein EI94DRAFT_747908 [Lactarius quietus]
MDTHRRNREIQFRVLIVGRANAGKTTVLQRICDTTKSSIIYMGIKEAVLEPSVDRSDHNIDEELVFSNLLGYVFHDSRGFESGGTEELEILKDFIRRKCGERRVQDRLHAIWYCVPMSNSRPSLDLKYYDGICPDPNVSVIAVFTKYDQFLCNVEMDMFDDPDKYPEDDVDVVVEKLFQDHYLRPLGNDVRYVRLENMHMRDSRCDELIETTAAALNEDIVTSMLSVEDQSTTPNTVAPMDTQQPRRRIPEIQFRVLIIGRANAGKTSVLQRVCETTKGTIIYRGNEEVILDPSVNRGEHDINDELVFSNLLGYVFHDSRGFKSGSVEELEIVKEFIRRKCGERRLQDRLHAIWFVCSSVYDYDN